LVRNIEQIIYTSIPSLIYSFGLILISNFANETNFHPKQALINRTIIYVTHKKKIVYVKGKS